MDWTTYYDRFYDWAESTQISRISSITDFDGDVSDQVAEIVQSIYDGKAATRLVKRAQMHGVCFTADEIESMLDFLDTIPDELLLECKTRFTAEQLDAVSELCNNTDVLNRVADQSGLDVVYGDDPEPVWRRASRATAPKESHGMGCLAALVVFGTLFGAKKKKHNRRCDGDCDNCPAHYGYRYGRWYYGHSHTYGCEFGGNKGGGGKD